MTGARWLLFLTSFTIQYLRLLSAVASAVENSGSPRDWDRKYIDRQFLLLHRVNFYRSKKLLSKTIPLSSLLPDSVARRTRIFTAVNGKRLKKIIEWWVINYAGLVLVENSWLTVPDKPIPFDIQVNTRLYFRLNIQAWVELAVHFKTSELSHPEILIRKPIRSSKNLRIHTEFRSGELRLCICIVLNF